MIKHQEDRYGWVFAFMGVGLDAVKQGQAIGVRINTLVGASGQSMSSAYDSHSNAMSAAPQRCPQETMPTQRRLRPSWTRTTRRTRVSSSVWLMPLSERRCLWCAECFVPFRARVRQRFCTALCV